MIYAVIDTNVLISALLPKTKKKSGNTATEEVLLSIFARRIVPLYHSDILLEYDDVLHRKKFPFTEDAIQRTINTIHKCGIEVFPRPTGKILDDMGDLIFYEVAMERRDINAYLVTGNQRHYPTKDFIVTPAEMVDILKKHYHK